MSEMINKIINTNLCCEEFDLDINRILEIKDESVTAPDDYANTKSLINVLSNCIIKLTNKEQFVITKRFGLFGNNPETLSCIAKQIGSGRERVRQLECRAIRKLGHPAFKLTELINEI
jgi:DNA-directed RNA polymerase sigma subunit (sigma70/sigma32)